MQTMSDPNATVSCQKFEGGITNGAEWYEIQGGMQDFNYLYTNCMEITVELSCVKKPVAALLAAEWEASREALLAWLEAVAGAVRGLVLTQQGEPVPAARVEVIGRGKAINPSSAVRIDVYKGIGFLKWASFPHARLFTHTKKDD